MFSPFFICQFPFLDLFLNKTLSNKNLCWLSTFAFKIHFALNTFMSFVNMKYATVSETIFIALTWLSLGICLPVCFMPCLLITRVATFVFSLFFLHLILHLMNCWYLRCIDFILCWVLSCIVRSWWVEFVTNASATNSLSLCFSDIPNLETSIVGHDLMGAILKLGEIQEEDSDVILNGSLKCKNPSRGEGKTVQRDSWLAKF